MPLARKARSLHLRVPPLLVLSLAALPRTCMGHIAAPLLLRQVQRKACAPCQGREQRFRSVSVRVSPEDAPFSCCDELAKPPSGGDDQASGGGSQAGGQQGPSPTGHFYLERIGLQGSGVLGIEELDESNHEPSLCLTATEKEDTVGGFGLSFQVCEGGVKTQRSATSVHRLDPELRRAQKFQFMPNGEVRTANGLCIRRMRCATIKNKGMVFVYDVGRCNGPGYVAKFIVERPAANSLDRLQTLGFPERLLRASTCEACGPFMLLEQCLSFGDRYPVNSQVCGDRYQATPGFTKLPSTYIGDAAVHGRAPSIESVDTVSDRLQPLPDRHQDFTGLAATDFDGLCGSFAGDGLGMDSFFIFHRALE